MKGSLIILAVFVTGLLAGYVHIFPKSAMIGESSTYVLYMLMFLVGFSVGADKHIGQQFSEIRFSILIVPFTIILGTGIGMTLYHIIFSYPDIADVYACGFGLGYYSLSSVIVSKISGETIGIIALLANIIREVLTLVLTPFFARHFGKLAPVAAAGATSSDTTLPVIVKYSGKEYIFISVINGIVLTLLVPVIIAFIYWLF